MSERLIYDVGVMDGADTAFYLKQGFRVVGVEASPYWTEQLQKRFAAELSTGQLTLLNIGVGEIDGELEFWMSEAPQWSSFDRELASREGTAARPVAVPIRVFRDVLAQYGDAYYCKIDIEGGERACLRTLTPQTSPRYISVELTHADAGVDLEILRSLGYDRFKIMSQVTRAQPSRLLTPIAYALPASQGRLMRRAMKRFLGVREVDGWRFSGMSSGPFAEQTPGPWRSYQDTVGEWNFLRDLHYAHPKTAINEWYDIHATR